MKRKRRSDKNPPIPTENSKINGQHKNITNNFDYTTIADRRSIGVTIVCGARLSGTAIEFTI